MFVKLLYLIIIFLAFNACQEKVTDVVNSFSVSGTIFQNNTPLTGATVALDQMYNYTTYTDQYGYFMITGVPEGDHDLSIIKTYDDGSFTEKSAQITVVQDLILDEIRLPNAVILYPADSITATSVKINWAPSNATDFREYKIYRHTTSGLDENTGTLVHVSTIKTDTVFTDRQLEALQDYYYRVYVMNEFGRLGGSNLISFRTLNNNIVHNGDFENFYSSSNLPVDWDIETSYSINPFTLVSGNAASGQKSLQLKITDGLHNTHRFSQFISPADFSPGERYELSFYMKHDSLIKPPRIMVFLEYNDYEYSFLEDIMPGVGNSVDESPWERYSIKFSALDIIDIVNYNLRFEIWTSYPSSGNQTYRLWFDNVRIERID
jgi:hypothetical protein